MIGADGDALDVAGSQRRALVEQSPLNHRSVGDQHAVLPCQGMHAAEGVVPVLLGHVVEGLVEQCAPRIKARRCQIRGVGYLDARHDSEPMPRWSLQASGQAASLSCGC